MIHCDWSKIFLASHSARAFDPACSAALVVPGVQDDGVHQRFVATTPGWTLVVASDKDHSHSFAARLLLRQELPQFDPLAGDPCEAEKALAPILEAARKRDGGESKDTKKIAQQKAREIVAALREGVVPDELLALQRKLRQGVKIKKDGEEKIDAALAKVEALIACISPAEEDLAAAREWLSRAQSTSSPDVSTPLRQRLKQLVLPGPAGSDDVVVTPLPALQILKTLREIYDLTEGYGAVRNRFAGYQRGYKNLQNTGVKDASAMRVVVHRFTTPPAPQTVWDVIKLPEVAQAIEALRTKLLHRRVYLGEQKMSFDEPARSDIEQAFAEAADVLGREIAFAVGDLEPERAKAILDDVLPIVLGTLRGDKRMAFRARETELIRNAINKHVEEVLS
jgi:hypothetical protein